MMSSFRRIYPLFSLQTNHVLGVHRWSEVKPAENDEVIYEEPLIDDALNAGLNFKMVEKELYGKVKTIFFAHMKFIVLSFAR